MPGIEDQIQRAIQEGKFSDLPGKGQPLHLDDDPFADPDWRLAYHLLRQNGFTLPWLELRKEIEHDHDQASASLRTAYKSRHSSLEQNRQIETGETDLERAERLFRQQIQRLNQSIFDYNLQAPSTRFQMRLLDPEAEISLIRSQSE